MASVSIITVNFNGGNTLPRLLKSTAELLSNNDNLEHIIVDGGSTDCSLSLLDEYCSKWPNARYTSGRDAGIFDAMNKGIALSAGKYFIHLNSDDFAVNGQEWATALRRAAEDKADLLVADVPLSDGKQVMRTLPARPASLRHWRYGYHFPHQGTFFSRELFERLGPYDTEIGYIADKIFAYRVIDACPTLDIIYLESPVSVQMLGGVSSASTLTPWQTMLKVAITKSSNGYRAPLRRAVYNALYKIAMKYGFLDSGRKRIYTDDKLYSG